MFRSLALLALKKFPLGSASAAHWGIPMRDVILFIIIAISIPISFFNPYFGILMWTWITFFNPHRYTWGFMYNFPIAAVIAVPTLLGCFFTSDINRRILKRETFLLAALWAWFSITFLYALQVPL